MLNSELNLTVTISKESTHMHNMFFSQNFAFES